MKIILSQDGSNRIPQVVGWLDYTGIAHEYKEFWDQSSKQFVLPENIEHTIVVWNHSQFENFLTGINSFDPLLDFCLRGNQLWIMGIDSAAPLSDLKDYRTKIQQLDPMLPKSSLVLFLDADPDDQFYVSRLEHIGVKVMKYNFCFAPNPRPQSKSLDKSFATKDYLLTMILKPNRYHRDLLWQQLQADSDLMTRGRISVRTKKDDPWLGDTTGATNPIMHASMDLYLDCYLEIVPEGHYQDLYMFTEKTHKPIMTKTPFLSISTAGYLDYLRKKGFKTFGSLIDESYDNHALVQDRVSGLITILKDIIANGSDKFYQASQSILDHNFSRLCEISGAWQYEFDQMMWQALEEFRDSSKP